MDNGNSRQTELISDLKRLFKDKLYDSISGKVLGGIGIKYIAALNAPEDIVSLKKYLDEKPDLSYTEINIAYFDAVYIEATHDFAFFILSVKREYITIDPEVMNYSMDQKVSEALTEAIRNLKLKAFEHPDQDSLFSIAGAFILNIANCLNISLDEFRYIVYKNSINNYLKIYNDFRKEPESIRDFNWDSYDHMRYFGLWYYAMIKVMSDIFKSGRYDSGFIIHDAGTSVAQFPVMLAASRKEELMGLEVGGVIASDIHILGMEYAKLYLDGITDAKPANFISCDFLDEENELPEADVTILNDVLEHFQTEEISFHVMERFWNKTRKLLIVHVPQEEEPNEVWGHYISFNRNKLLEWANRLKGHRLLAETYRFSETCTYMDAGFLILERI